jgi:uncharacterized protein
MEVLCRLSYSGGRRDDSNVVRSGVLAVVVLALASCSHATARTSSQAYPVKALFRSASREAVLHVSIARTDAEKQRGLMHVTSLPEDEGMAFVWDSPIQTAFWMKDTLIPLSVAFVDEHGRIVTIRDMQPCTADPCTTYAPTAPYVTAVEANRGWFDDHGIGLGDRLMLEPSA